MNNPHLLSGFAPIVSDNARLLILGSMPSETSLKKHQYYGHPRNAFWPIMQELFFLGENLDYQQKKQVLMQKGIAVWDVLKSCSRPGSLDSSIAMDSIQINDFNSFFVTYPFIKHVFFNGVMAEKIYRKYVLENLEEHFSSLQYQRLPSTSPANASKRLVDKLAAWQVIKKCLMEYRFM